MKLNILQLALAKLVHSKSHHSRTIEVPCSIPIGTVQEHQWILTYAAVSKDSDFGFIMVVYQKRSFKYFKVFERNEEIWIKTSIEQKYYKIG